MIKSDRYLLYNVFKKKLNDVERRREELGCCAEDLYYHLCMQAVLVHGFVVDYETYDLMYRVFHGSSVL